MTSHSILIDPALSGQRLDKALSLALPRLTRSRIAALIAAGAVTRDGQVVVDVSRKVKQGEYYLLAEPEAEPSHFLPWEEKLAIVYEDAHLLVVNKPAGMTVHPAAGNRSHTLVNALLAHCGDTLSGIGGVARPGIVHRIDKDTSGLLVVAKTDAAHQHLAAQLKARTLKRTYTAYVWRAPPREAGLVDAPIARHPTKRKQMAVVKGGREARTHYEVDMHFGSIASRITCHLDTGRTHQIRVHCAHIKCPMIGDPVYGLAPASVRNLMKNHSVPTLARQALHARELALIHPHTGEEMRFTAPMPEDLQVLEEGLQTLTASP